MNLSQFGAVVINNLSSLLYHEQELNKMRLITMFQQPKIEIIDTNFSRSCNHTLDKGDFGYIEDLEGCIQLFKIKNELI